MAARERHTASYASIPFATVPDKAAMATRQRVDEAEDDKRIAAAVFETISAAPQRWKCARATDLIGEGARIRSALTDGDDPE